MLRLPCRRRRRLARWGGISETWWAWVPAMVKSTILIRRRQGGGGIYEKFFGRRSAIAGPTACLVMAALRAARLAVRRRLVLFLHNAQDGNVKMIQIRRQRRPNFWQSAFFHVLRIVNSASALKTSPAVKKNYGQRSRVSLSVSELHMVAVCNDPLGGGGKKAIF
jgi:hypothetical protein